MAVQALVARAHHRRDVPPREIHRLDEERADAVDEQLLAVLPGQRADLGDRVEGAGRGPAVDHRDGVGAITREDLLDGREIGALAVRQVHVHDGLAERAGELEDAIAVGAVADDEEALVGAQAGAEHRRHRRRAGSREQHRLVIGRAEGVLDAAPHAIDERRSRGPRGHDGVLAVGARDLVDRLGQVKDGRGERDDAGRGHAR